MSNVEKGMIIAFFVIFGVISTVSNLVRHPWSAVKNFLHRYYKRGTVRISHRPASLRSLPNEINRLSYALYGRTGSTHMNESAESTPPAVLFPPSIVCSTNTM